MRFGLRELLFLVVLLSVPVASFIFVFKPRNEEIRQAAKEVETKTAKLDKLREISGRIENIGEAIEEWREAVRIVEGKLPSEQGIEEILEQVWNLTEKNNLTILSTQAEPAVPTATYMELPLKVEITGDFDAFYQFLLELEQLPRITRIHQLMITRVGYGKSSRRAPKPKPDEVIPPGAMYAEFTLSIYYEAGRRVASGQ